MCIVEEMLESIKDDMILLDSNEPWVGKLVDAINKAIVELKLDRECISLDSNGKQLREALQQLPAPTQVTILNDCVISYGNVLRRLTDRAEYEDHEQDIKERQLKHDLIKYGAIVFMFLITIFVSGMIFLNWKQSTTPDSAVATGMFSTLLEILKLIFQTS